MTRYKQVIIYGIALAIIIFVLKWLEMRYVLVDQQLDTYIGIVAIIFTGLGIWLALKLRKPKVETVIVEKQVYLEDFSINEEEIKRLNLSKRELEILPVGLLVSIIAALILKRKSGGQEKVSIATP